MRNYTPLRDDLGPDEAAAIYQHYQTLPETERAAVLRLARLLGEDIRHLGDKTCIEIIYSVIRLARQCGETLQDATA